MNVFLKIFLGSIALKLLLLEYPIVFLLAIISGCVVSWFLNPKLVMQTSIMTCTLLVGYEYVSTYKALHIMFGHAVLLLVIGCLLSRIIVKNGLHKLIASNIMGFFQPKTEQSLVLIMMLTSILLSMWISNTSVVAMLIPVVMTLGKELSISCKGMLLSIGYGATLGGMLTPIGTPSNIVAVDYASRYFDIQIDFAMWFKWAAPFVLMLFVSIMLFFIITCDRKTIDAKVSADQFSNSQFSVMLCLIICVLLWGTQTLPYGGWSALLGVKISEEIIGGVVLAVLYFITTDSGDRAFAFNDFGKISYNSIWMVVTGIFMAEALVAGGAIQMVIDLLNSSSGLHNYQALAVFGFILSFVTELCSNTAVTAMGLPLTQIMMKISTLDALPCIFLITLSANSAFMLPTSTPPNALILGTGRLSSKYMLTRGLLISMVSLFILIIYMT